MKRSLTFCVLGNSFITWVGRTATSARLPWWQGHTQTLKVPICVVSDALNCPHLLTKTKCLSVCLSSAGGEGWRLGLTLFQFSQLSSVAQLCPTLGDPMDCSTQGFLVHHQLLEFTQTHVHWVSDATQPSHPLSSPSPPAFNLSQHQGLFKWVGSLHQVAKALEFQLQHQSFQWIFRTDFL